MPLKLYIQIGKYHMTWKIIIEWCSGNLHIGEMRNCFFEIMEDRSCLALNYAWESLSSHADFYSALSSTWKISFNYKQYQ